MMGILVNIDVCQSTSPIAFDMNLVHSIFASFPAALSREDLPAEGTLQRRPPAVFLISSIVCCLSKCVHLVRAHVTEEAAAPALTNGPTMPARLLLMLPRPSKDAQIYAILTLPISDICNFNATEGDSSSRLTQNGLQI